MRYDPSVCTWRRLAAKASTINGIEIPAGANLLLMLHSANRDESVFPEPDNIIFERGNLKDQLAFGYGIHYCVGAPLARLEMAILLETLTRELPEAAAGGRATDRIYAQYLLPRSRRAAGHLVARRHNSKSATQPL